MKEKLFLISAALVGVSALTACIKTEDDPVARQSDILFKVDSISSDKSVRIEYMSPDPAHAAYMYYISSDSKANYLNLACTNCDSIYILGNGGMFEGKLECVEPGRKYRSRQGCWTVSTTNRNHLKFEFEQVAKGDSLYINRVNVSDLEIGAKTPQGKVSTVMNITRWAIL